MFISILHPGQAQPEYQNEAPCFFRDLNLGTVFDFIPPPEHGFNLAPVYFTPLQDPELIRYRQDILKDLTDGRMQPVFSEFSEAMRALSEHLLPVQEDVRSSDPWKNNELTRGRFLDYTRQYCLLLQQLQADITGADFHSRGLQDFSEYLNTVCSSEAFLHLCADAKALKNEFDRIRYCILLKNNTIRVRKYQGDEDLSAAVTDAFAKFRLEKPMHLQHRLPKKPYADHVEAGILSCLSRLYPHEFESLDQFVCRYFDFIDPVLLRFCREIRFYLLWLNKIRPLKEKGLHFFIPDMQIRGSRFFCSGFFDIALALQIGSRIVPNDFNLEKPERILVITGPNQGGKTTFARAIGQIHFLASLGLCVPGTGGILMIPDRIFTHFEREEVPSAQNGKLKDDLERLKAIADKLSGRSLVIINEIFASTTAQDAEQLGTHMMDLLAESGAIAAVVTFLDQPARHGPEVVSLMSTVAPGPSSLRTFRIVRKAPDGLVCAGTLAEKHGLTYEQLLRRLPK